MPIIHRLATEEDLATWPALFVGFGRRPSSSDDDPPEDKPEPTPAEATQDDRRTG